MASNAPRRQLELTEIPALISLLATVLAICFVLGYFSAIGLNFMMLFSLSEHVTAAIPSLPIAVLAAFVVGMTILSQRVESSVSNFFRPLRKGVSAKWIALLALVAIVVLVTGLALTWLILRTIPRSTGAIVLVISSGALIMPLAYRFTTLRNFAIVCVGLSLLTAFFIGRYLCVQTLESNLTPYEATLTNVTYSGSLLYGGERGILFYEPTRNRIFYFRNEDVKIVSRARPGS